MNRFEQAVYDCMNPTAELLERTTIPLHRWILGTRAFSKSTHSTTWLEKALRAKGLSVEIANAGVSGDTASGGLARLDWAVPPGTDAVIVELGANDMLRGVDPKVTRKALEEIVRRLTERRLPLLLAGMRAAPNLGDDYVRDFEAIYPDLARSYDLLLYPFFLDGIFANARFNQRDGLHPTAACIDRIVTGILPKAEELVARVRDKRGQ